MTVLKRQKKGSQIRSQVKEESVLVNCHLCFQLPVFTRRLNHKNRVVLLPVAAVLE